MRKIEKEFEQIAAFIRARRNGAIGFLKYGEYMVLQLQTANREETERILL